MAKLMWICGILLIAAGVALGIVLLVSAARPGGIDIHTAAILLVGGILSLGLGSVIEGLHARPTVRSLIPEPVIPASTAAIPEFDPRSAKPAAAAVVAAAVIVEEEVSRPTRDTIQALEQARQKIEKAFEDRTEQPQSAEAPAAEPEEAEPAPKDVAAAEVEDETITEDMSEEEVIDDGQLYVVEERVIRRHPARILSDGTVEAETAEGWMRFENLEHLDEYLDAMEQARS
ncbi:MAG: hypothetical protein RJA94_279 [Pseudomonadota bacterium]